MSVHYGYNYKKDLIKKMRLLYAKELKALAIRRNQQEQLDQAKQLILNFFEEEREEFSDLAVATNQEVSYTEDENGYFLKLRIHQASIQFTRQEDSIEIEITSWNEADKYLETNVVAYVIPGEDRCRLRVVGKVHEGAHFDENTINSYIRVAFAHLLGEEQATKET